VSQTITSASPIKKKKKPGPAPLSRWYLISPSRFRSREKISWKAKKRVIAPAVCAELSRNGLLAQPVDATQALNFSASIRTVCCHCLANAWVCPTAAVWGDHTGETMAKLLTK
jgi:hypothetical protein